ncbi:DUF2512 family protein, partial [Bacillus sp. JJ722]
MKSLKYLTAFLLKLVFSFLILYMILDLFNNMSFNDVFIISIILVIFSF